MKKEKVYTVEQSPNGTLRFKNEHGELHRIDGPAIICKNGKDGFVDCEEWLKKGRLHRLDGHARSGYKKTKEGETVVDWAQYWIDGDQLSEEKFKERTTVKEMTMDEINTELGCMVKIVD